MNSDRCLNTPPKQPTLEGEGSRAHLQVSHFGRKLTVQKLDSGVFQTLR